WLADNLWRAHPQINCCSRPLARLERMHRRGNAGVLLWPLKVSLGACACACLIVRNRTTVLPGISMVILATWFTHGSDSSDTSGALPMASCHRLARHAFELSVRTWCKCRDGSRRVLHFMK